MGHLPQLHFLTFFLLCIEVLLLLLFLPLLALLLGLLLLFTLLLLLIVSLLLLRFGFFSPSFWTTCWWGGYCNFCSLLHHLHHSCGPLATFGRVPASVVFLVVVGWGYDSSFFPSGADFRKMTYSLIGHSERAAPFYYNINRTAATYNTLGMFLKFSTSPVLMTALL